jgi:dihydroflavonol-4-reductase
MIVITGATGLLGSILMEHFVAANIPVTGLFRQTHPNYIHDLVTWKEADVNDMPGLIKCFEGATCVVHGAAMVSFAKRNLEKMFRVNVEGTANVVNACLRSNVKRLVHISSIAALGKPSNQTEINEGTAWKSDDKYSNYGLTKHLAECEVFRGEAEGLSVAIVNPSVIIAAGNTDRSSGKMIQYAFDESPYYTEGQINYVDARDVAKIVHHLCEDHLRTGRFIANAGAISLKGLLDLMAIRLNKRPPYIKVSNSIARIAAALEWIRCTITNREPLITMETVRFAKQNFFYSNKKALNELGITFHSLQDSIEWSCGTFLNSQKPKV